MESAALLALDSFMLPNPPSGPPRIGPEDSTVIMIVAVLFLAAVFAFYYYVR